ncbi:MAG: rod shape-determining protein MreC [Lachnospirales bacterium]
MAKKKKSFYASLRDLTKVPLRDLKPLKIEKNRHPIHMSLKKRILFVTILCVFLMILTLSLGRNWGPLNTVFNAVASPVQQALSAVGDWFSSLSENARSAEELRKENEQLRQQMDALRYENTLQEVQLTKYQELNDLYDLDSYYVKYPKTAAQIIGISANNWNASMTIDKGSADGIQDYMPVLSGDGLLGHVKTVYRHYSKIVSLLSEESYVHGEVLRSGDHVGVEGDITLEQDGLCKIEFYIGQTDIAVGDEIVTSSLSDIYPPGIRIGEITEIEEAGDGVIGIAYLRPDANVKNISYVLIITDQIEKNATSEETEREDPSAENSAVEDSSSLESSSPEDSGANQEGTSHEE